MEFYIIMTTIGITVFILGSVFVPIGIRYFNLKFLTTGFIMLLTVDVMAYMNPAYRGTWMETFNLMIAGVLAVAYYIFVITFAEDLGLKLKSKKTKPANSTTDEAPARASE